MVTSLIFDTETTGKVNWRQSPSHVCQPRVVQLAAELFDGGRSIASINLIVKPPVSIPKEAADIHGITDSFAQAYGVPPVVAIAMFNNLAKHADRLVAHNISFDLFMLQIEYLKHDKSPVHLLEKPNVCTMKSTTDVCEIPAPWKGAKEFKWPKLEEAYKILVDKAGFDGAHDALVDVRACRKVLLALEYENLPLVRG